MSKENNNWLIGAIIGIGALTALNIMRKNRRELSFKNKVVLITGGSRGLGLVLAREFAAEGAKIAICARNHDELLRAKADLHESGAEVFEVVCDVRNEEQVNQMIDDVYARYGNIDVLINNAGVIQVGPLETQTKEDFKNALDIHFWGSFYTMQAVIPKMRAARAGRIVNISSIGGKVSVPHLAPYCASKFALVGLSSAMRSELIKDNIFVTTVCPGLMRTGSHVNAMFKGKNELEFALFSLMNASPLTSVSAERAAREIIEACRRGEAEKIISVPAQIAAKANAVLPELVGEVAGLVSYLLPSAGEHGTEQLLGKHSTSSLSPSFLTASLDAASVRNNELKPNETIQ